MKKALKIITFIIAVVIFIPCVSVKAVSYDGTSEPVLDIEVKDDGTITWTRSLYAYGIWIQSDLNDNYYTALINEVMTDEPSVNLIDLIENKCPNSSYGCSTSKEGTYKVLIKENSGAENYRNSEFTVTYENGKLSGTIVNAVKYAVTLHTNGGVILSDDIDEYIAGESTMLPTDLEKEGFFFAGWYDNEELAGDFIVEIEDTETGDKEYWAKWEEMPELESKEYTLKPVNEDSDNSISFTALEGNTYTFFMNDIMSIKDEDIKQTADQLNDPEFTYEKIKEQLNKLIAYGKKLADGNDSLLKIYEINLDTNGNEVHQVDGGFKIKIKITDDIKGYDSYKLIYIADDGTTEDAIALAQNGDYLEGILPHLSMYALIGSKSENEQTTKNPKTDDDVVFNISLLGLSVIGLIVSGLYVKNNKLN